MPAPADGVEVMVGMTNDPLFGPLIAFGLGGIHVEILGDVRFRITPLTDRDAAEMVREIKGYRLLQGYRGHPAADVEAIEDVLLRLSRLVEEIPEISELDLNPDTVRNYFGADHYDSGKVQGVHFEQGPNGGIVELDDTRILDMARQMINEEKVLH